MNPLDLTGPEFLRFYVPYGLCGVALGWLMRMVLERLPGPEPSARWTPGTYPREGDAYAIALLRGGRPEAARTFLGRLVSAGLLEVDDRQVRAVPGMQEASAQLQPLERTAWHALQSHLPLAATEAQQRLESALDADLRAIDGELAREGLVPAGSRKTALQALLLATWLAVGGLGVLKILVAISRGRLNLGFLILLVLGFTWLIVRLLRLPRQTQAARRYLDWLQESHRGLVRLLESGRRDHAGEMALAASIYGLAAIPGLSPLGTACQPPPPAQSSGSGCGSGSSCSSGSSCGGGCGGGCGGCGG